MSILTTATRIDLNSLVEIGDATEMAFYLVSRLIDERDENRAHDHWHPELGTAFAEMAAAWIQALKQAGVTFEYRGARDWASGAPGP